MTIRCMHYWREIGDVRPHIGEMNVIYVRCVKCRQDGFRRLVLSDLHPGRMSRVVYTWPKNEGEWI